MPARGKKYRAAQEKIDPEKLYTPEEAIDLAKSTSFAKFDETVELHLRLGVDPRHADQQVRDVVILPHGLGKEVRVLVFAEGEGAKAAAMPAPTLSRMTPRPLRRSKAAGLNLMSPFLLQR